MTIGATTGKRARVENCDFSLSKLNYIVDLSYNAADFVDCVATNCSGYFAYIGKPCSFTGCFFAGNGGTAQFNFIAGGATPVGITNCVVVRNRSMGVRLGVSGALNVSVSHCTIADNETTSSLEGGGVYFNSTANRITDSIVHGNLNFGVPADITLAGTAPAPTRCCFGEADEEDGNGNIASDPLFADPAARRSGRHEPGHRRRRPGGRLLARTGSARQARQPRRLRRHALRLPEPAAALHDHPAVEGQSRRNRNWPCLR